MQILNVEIEPVPYWQTAWKWFSMQAMGMGAIVEAVWLGMPSDLKESLDPTWVNGVALTLFVLGMIGRMIDQPLKDATLGK